MTSPRVSELDNGLRVLLLESHEAPVATFWVWYAVGSRNEVLGTTGISHFVEHMLFKGTPARPKASLTRAIERLGGRWNAFTYKDYTAYHQILPAEHLGFIVEMEADRMQNTLFEPEEVESERTVIIAEREGGENHPGYVLYEEVDALTYKVHPYRQPVIGWKSDLRRMTRDALYGHYRAYYQPRNALVVAVGAFKSPALLDQIRRAFGGIEPRPAVDGAPVEEPPQEGERRVVVRRPGGGTSYLQMAFRIPQASHPDFPALLMLEGILSGPDSLRESAGGTARSSRLYRALIERRLATSAYGSALPARDPGVFRLAATVRSGVPVDAVEEALLAELDRLGREEVPAGELARVRRQVRAQFVYTADGVYRWASAIGAFAVIDHPEAFFTLERRMAAVMPADLQRVAAETFVAQQRTVGWYIPEVAGAVTKAPAVAAVTPWS